MSSDGSWLSAKRRGKRQATWSNLQLLMFVRVRASWRDAV